MRNHKINFSRKNFLKIIFCGGFTFLEIACTTIRVNPPLPIALSPRLGVSDKLLLRANIEPALEIVTDGMYSRPPNITNSVSGGYGINQTPEVGYTKSSFEITGGAYPATQGLGVWGQSKVQLVGPQGIINSADSFFTVYGRLGSQTSTASGDQKVIFGGGGYPWTGDVKVTFATVGASLGKTFNKWLVYLGGAYMDFPVNATATQRPADDASDPGGQYKRKFYGISSSAGLGFEYLFSERRSLGFNVHYTTYDYDGYRDYIAPASLYIKIL